MKTPFKFLDAYAPEDRDAFFGREAEVAELYDMLAKNRLVLIYGQSGTGKTSLVQCGLAARFEAADWLPLTVRRQNDVNRSLEKALSDLAETKPGTPLGRMLDAIFANHLRPVYLIFDQLEELFVLGETPEIETFATNVRALLDARSPVRILFIVREEYLVHLYDLERALPQLFDRRLRVEPMNRAKLRAVLEGSFRKFNIEPQAAPEETFDEIIAQISGARSKSEIRNQKSEIVQLPFLQVWLDRFYRKTFSENRPSQDPGVLAEPNFPVSDWPKLTFLRGKIRAFGDLGDVLEDFLREQKKTLEGDLKTRFPGLEPGAVDKILDAFVSEEGTKRPMAYDWQDEALHIEKRWADLFRGISPETLGFACRRLEQARLLRFTGEYVELAHDTLAAHIDGGRTQTQRNLQNAWNTLAYHFRDFQNAPEKEHLSAARLRALEPWLPALEGRMDADMRRFLADSRARVEQTEQEKTAGERRRFLVAAAAAVLFGALAVLSFGMYQRSENAKREISRTALEARLSVARTLKVQGQYPGALEQLKAVQVLASEVSPEKMDSLKILENNWLRTQTLMLSGQNFGSADRWSEAIARFDSARTVESDGYILGQLAQAQQALETKFVEFKKSGNARLNTREHALAAAYFTKALDLKPGDAEVLRLLEKCGGQ